MEEFVERSYLYDFYGELLTEHQKRIYREIVFDDFSESEVASDEGISRQGVHDLMRRCDRQLRDYESRLHLVEKFMNIRNNVRKIQMLTESGGDSGEKMAEIRKVSEDILTEL